MTDTSTVRDRIMEAAKRRATWQAYCGNEKLQHGIEDLIRIGYEDGARFGLNMACGMLESEGIRRNEPDPTDTGMGWAKWLRSKMKDERGEGR